MRNHLDIFRNFAYGATVGGLVVEANADRANDSDDGASGTSDPVEVGDSGELSVNNLK